LGFCPFPLSAPPIGEKKGRVGEEEEERGKTVRRVAAGTSLLGIDGNARSWTREAPFVTAEEPDRSVAPPTTSSLRRLHHRPAVSTVAFLSLAPYLLLAMPVRVPSCRRTLVVSSFF
jgi:hypothetical protein